MTGQMPGRAGLKVLLGDAAYPAWNDLYTYISRAYIPDAFSPEEFETYLAACDNKTRIEIIKRMENA